MAAGPSAAAPESTLCLKALLVLRLAFLTAFLLAVVSGLASLFLHLAGAVTGFMLFLAIAALCQAAMEAIRIRLAFLQGRWLRLDGQLGSREAQPGRFRALVVMHGLLMLAPLAAGARCCGSRSHPELELPPRLLYEHPLPVGASALRPTLSENRGAIWP